MLKCSSNIYASESAVHWCIWYLPYRNVPRGFSNISETGTATYWCIRYLSQCDVSKVSPIFMHPKLLPSDVYGTYPNATFRKVLPLFMHLDPIPTVSDTPKGSPKIYASGSAIHKCIRYGTYSNTTFLKVLPTFMHTDPLYLSRYSALYKYGSAHCWCIRYLLFNQVKISPPLLLVRHFNTYLYVLLRTGHCGRTDTARFDVKVQHHLFKQGTSKYKTFFLRNTKEDVQ